MKSGLNSPQISSDTAFLMNILKKGYNETQIKLLQERIQANLNYGYLE